MPAKRGKTSKPKLQTGISGVNPKATMKLHRRADVKKCAACGKDHTKVLFFLREGWETKKFQYRAGCPISGKEILLKVS